MKLLPCFAPVLLAATLAAQSVPAQPTDDPAQVRFKAERPAGLLLRVLDRNRDGTLSHDELQLVPIALTAFDLDGDSFLSADELSAANRAQGRRATAEFASHVRARSTADFNLILALDANHDGIVQPLEVVNAASSLQRLDRNGDGALTPDELRPLPRHDV